MAFDTFAVGVVDFEGTKLRSAFDVNENPNVTLFRRHHSGRISPIYSVTSQIAPKVTFNTLECGIVLALLGPIGRALANTIVYYTRCKQVTRSTGADHLKSTLTSGIAVPRTLSWGGGVSAWTLGVELLPDSVDGLTAPIAYGTAALPALAVIPETFTGGKFVVNSGAGDVEVDCWQNASLDFGVTANPVFHKGLPAPVRSAVQTATPSFRISNLNPTDRTTFGQFGTRVVSSTLYLRKNETAAGLTPTRVLDATAQHVKISMLGGIIYPGQTTAPETGDDTQEIMIAPEENDATAAIVITTGVAIP